MPFYRHQLTFAQLEPLIETFLEFLRNEATIVKDSTEEDDCEVFFIDLTISELFKTKYRAQAYTLVAAGYMQQVPFDNEHLLIYYDPHKQGIQQTVSPRHLRIPKLTYLMPLTPEDFFNYFYILHTSKNASFNTLSLNLSALDPKSVIYAFFTKLKVNYRLNIKIASPHWTPRELIAILANIPPTRDNQLAALQYLAVAENEDVAYFPTESMLALDLEWKEARTPEYVVSGFLQ